MRSVDPRPRGRNGIQRGSKARAHPRKAQAGIRPKPSREVPSRIERRKPFGQGRSSGSWTRVRWFEPSYWSPLPGSQTQCCWRIRFHIPLRGSSGFSPDSLFSRSVTSGTFSNWQS